MEGRAYDDDAGFQQVSSSLVSVPRPRVPGRGHRPRVTPILGDCLAIRQSRLGSSSRHNFRCGVSDVDSNGVQGERYCGIERIVETEQSPENGKHGLRLSGATVDLASTETRYLAEWNVRMAPEQAHRLWTTACISRIEMQGDETRRSLVLWSLSRINLVVCNQMASDVSNSRCRLPRRHNTRGPGALYGTMEHARVQNGLSNIHTSIMHEMIYWRSSWPRAD